MKLQGLIDLIFEQEGGFGDISLLLATKRPGIEVDQSGGQFLL